MLTVKDKIFILEAIKNSPKFFLNPINIDTIYEMQNRIGKEKLHQVINILKGV